MIEGKLIRPQDPLGARAGADGAVYLTHTFANGDVYSGGWMGGPHGQGAMTLAAGGRYEGDWEFGAVRACRRYAVAARGSSRATAAHFPWPMRRRRRASKAQPPCNRRAIAA